MSGHAYTGDNALSLSWADHFLYPGVNGFPMTGDSYYMGAIVVVLAVCGVAVRWRRPAVMALAVVAVVMACLTFSQPVISVAADVAGSQTIRWPRAILLLSLALAVLAGMGMDVLVRSWRERAVLRWLGAGFLLAGAGLVIVAVVGGGDLVGIADANRSAAFIWPGVEVALGLVVVGVLGLARRGRPGERGPSWHRRSDLGRWAALALLVCETAFLATIGAPLWDSSPTYLPSTPTMAALQRAVGSSVLGDGESSDCSVLGIRENVNVAYGVHQFEVYDPMIPRAYFQTWKTSTGENRDAAGFLQYSTFCPAVSSAAIGRLFGVSYVLELAGKPGPEGAVLDTKVGDQTLYRIPGAAQATLTPLPGDGAWPDPGARGTPVEVTHPDPASWKLVTRARGPSVLRLRLTDVPGWHASIDGKPLTLQRFSGVMFQARVPAGTHSVELHYWPAAFTAGIFLAACSAVALAVMVVVAFRRRRAPGTAP